MSQTYRLAYIVHGSQQKASAWCYVQISIFQQHAIKTQREATMAHGALAVGRCGFLLGHYMVIQQFHSLVLWKLGHIVWKELLCTPPPPASALGF